MRVVLWEGGEGEWTGGWGGVTVPLALLSHEITEHYPPQ